MTILQESCGLEFILSFSRGLLTSHSTGYPPYDRAPLEENQEEEKKRAETMNFPGMGGGGSGMPPGMGSSIGAGGIGSQSGLNDQEAAIVKHVSCSRDEVCSVLSAVANYR